MALPLLLVCLVEVSLRWAGYGYPTDFLIRGEVKGVPSWISNAKFGWRFFPRWLSPTPHPVVTPLAKAPGAHRIFVLGESAAMGFPAPEYGFSRMLEALLQDRFPGEKIEVVNVSMVAINSNAVLPIARNCTSKSGDLWVVYMGNNEVIGPFGAQGLFGGRAPSLPLIRANLALRRLRLVQFVDSALSGLRRNRDLPPQWKGMQMWKARIPRDDPSLTRVQHNFEDNLRAIVRAGQNAGIPLIVCTVGCNLRDCSPFASLHRTGLSSAQLTTWQAAFDTGTKEEAAGQYAEAVTHYADAARTDSHYAELQFRLGECSLELGQLAQAKIYLEQAKDEDALQFRPDSRLNQVIRKVMAENHRTPMRLLDAQELFAVHSTNGIPGRELFYEHVHLTPAGNYLLARATAALASDLILPNLTGAAALSRGGWLDQTECERRIGLTDWGRYKALETIERLAQDPPFTVQSIQARRQKELGEALKRLRPAIHSAGLRRAAQAVQEALRGRPEDADLHRVLASILETDGANDRAEREWREVIALRPFAALPYLNLALLLSSEGRDAETAQLLAECLRRDPYNADAHGELGMLMLKVQRPKEAMAHLREVLRQQPDSVSGHLLLGRAYLSLGDNSSALGQFQRVEEIDPGNQEASALLRGINSPK
jgi:tetratricopeptide (TPR) repeat protein